jgi:hypothetical protein
LLSYVRMWHEGHFAAIATVLQIMYNV